MLVIRIDPQSERPIFEQIVFAVKQSSARGELKPGDRLPSVRDLARELAITPNTVVHAYEVLARDGLLIRRQGAGCFVSGRSNGLGAAERRRQIDDLVDRLVTEAFHLGVEPRELRKALERRLVEAEAANASEAKQDAEPAARKGGSRAQGGGR